MQQNADGLMHVGTSCTSTRDRRLSETKYLYFSTCGSKKLAGLQVKHERSRIIFSPFLATRSRAVHALLLLPVELVKGWTKKASGLQREAELKRFCPTTVQFGPMRAYVQEAKTLSATSSFLLVVKTSRAQIPHAEKIKFVLR